MTSPGLPRTDPATSAAPRWIDTHCHPRLIEGPEQVGVYVEQARAAGVTTLISIGFDDVTNAGVIEEAHTFPGVFCSQGVHPHEAGTATEATFAAITSRLDDPRVVAQGEMGLDYFRQYSEVPRQHEVFARQLALAQASGLPVVIHSRDAAADTYAMLKEAALPQGGVMHCYAYDAEWARQFLDLGFDISFSGVLTFPKAESLQEAARVLPLDRIHIETDAPWLAPVPHRGKTNQPAYTAHTGMFLAQLRGMDPVAVAAQLTANAHRRFPRIAATQGGN